MGLRFALQSTICLFSGHPVHLYMIPEKYKSILLREHINMAWAKKHRAGVSSPVPFNPPPSGRSVRSALSASFTDSLTSSATRIGGRHQLTAPGSPEVLGSRPNESDRTASRASRASRAWAHQTNRESEFRWAPAVRRGVGR